LTRVDGEDTRSMEIDIEGISRGEAGSAPVLSDGDAIYVPQALAQVAVLGEVGRPGVYRVERGATLMDVLASAGGPTDRADLSQVKMYEGGEAGSGVSLEIADDSLVYTGDILDNPKVAAGNVIVVPAGTIKVHVAGRVVRPGSYVLRKGAGVLEAVVAAGGDKRFRGWLESYSYAQSDGEVRAMEVDVDSILARQGEGSYPFRRGFALRSGGHGAGCDTRRGHAPRRIQATPGRKAPGCYWGCRRPVGSSFSGEGFNLLWRRFLFEVGCGSPVLAGRCTREMPGRTHI